MIIPIVNNDNMTTTNKKLEKIIDDINKKFDVNIKIFKAGGRWSVTSEKGNIESKKMEKIREFILMHSQDLEEDDDI